MSAKAAGPISIRARELRKDFGSVTALAGINLDFSAGLMHGVIGPEGAGKTTLMRIALGLMQPTSGDVEYSVGATPTPFDEVRPDVAYMPQQQALYADLSIAEHLDFFREMYGIPPEEYKQKREELLKITRLDKFISRPAGKLSGGMYKKLGLMCALLRSPKVMLLDEPTNGVDPISRREFWELLYRLADQQILIIVSTAYMDEAERCAQVHLMERGKVVVEGEPRALLYKEKVKSFDELFMKRGAGHE
jgi:ABC-2 type transport system ATP-binding protein